MKTVVVTGCNGGVGQAICKKLLQDNYSVIGLDISNESLIFHKSFSFFSVDLNDITQIRWFLEQLKDISGIYGIVNNAAIQICKPFKDFTVNDWDKTISINLKAPFFIVQGLMEKLIAVKGSVVNISSVHAVATSKDISIYAISKGGMSEMTRSLAVELAPHDVRVNSILPGAVDTPMLRRGLERNSSNISVEEKLKQLGSKHLLSRIGNPKEIAEVTSFLLEKKSSFITGQSIVVDGGATIRLSTE